MRLKDDEGLERSSVVANCLMNRERGLLGSNGYDRELGFNPLDALKARRAIAVRSPGSISAAARARP